MGKPAQASLVRTTGSPKVSCGSSFEFFPCSVWVGEKVVCHQSPSENSSIRHIHFYFLQSGFRHLSPRRLHKHPAGLSIQRFITRPPARANENVSSAASPTRNYLSNSQVPLLSPPSLTPSSNCRIPAQDVTPFCHYVFS